VEQFEGITRLGVSFYEPRLIGEKHVIKLSDEEINDLKELMAKYGITATSIGSPIGKVNIGDFEAHFEEFKRTVEVAKLLDCKYIRMFSFFAKTDEDAGAIENEVIEKLKIMV
jgi:sugar phosphate isomerase/epimerase